MKIELPTDGGFSRGSKIKVEVQGPGGTTIAASSTGVFVMSVPGVGTVALAGDWSAGTFALDDSGNAVGFGAIEGGLMSLRPVDPSCDGAACDLTATEAPDFLSGSTLRPDGDGGYETDFVADELSTILSFTGPITWEGDGVETTPLGELEFDVGIDDETAECPDRRLCCVSDPLPSGTSATRRQTRRSEIMGQVSRAGRSNTSPVPECAGARLSLGSRLVATERYVPLSDALAVRGPPRLSSGHRRLSGS